MASKNGFNLGKTVVDFSEQLITSSLEGRSPEMDTFTNFLSFGLHGGELAGEQCREWIFYKSSAGKFDLAGTRKYGKDQKPLEHISEINFDRNGKIAGYKSGALGLRPENAYPDHLAEELGLLRGITGGIIPTKVGDIQERGVKDLKSTRDLAAKIAIEHYFEKGMDPRKRKFIGEASDGNESVRFYTVEIPMSDPDRALPFRLFDFKGYDIELMFGDYFKTGTYAALLSPFYRMIKDRQKKKGFAIDPVLESQMELAHTIAKSGFGDAAYALYAPIAASYAVNKYLINGWNFNGKGTRTTQ